MGTAVSSPLRNSPFDQAQGSLAKETEIKGSGMDIGQSAVSKAVRGLVERRGKDAPLDRTMCKMDYRIRRGA